MAGPHSHFELRPGRQSERLLKALLLAELCEERLLVWRAGATTLFGGMSVLLYPLARWPEQFHPASKRILLASWLLSATVLAALILMTWQARRRRERILQRMEPRR